MSDHEVPSSVLEEERRIAHSGGLAQWAGHCARHPWRVIGSWFGIVVVLIGLNIAFHGTLVNEFKVPGTDFQKATDLIDAKFGAQKGAPLRVVIAAPAGETLQTPERQAAVSKMLEQATAGVRKLDENQKDVGAIADPLAPNSTQLSTSGRVAYFDAQFDRTGFELPRGDIVNLEDQLKATGQAAGLEVAFTGDAESPPPEDFLSIVLGLTAGFIILLVLFRALVPTAIPLLFAIAAVLLANSLLPAVLALLGHKIDRGRLGMKPSDESREGRLRTPVARWGRFVTRNAKFVLPAVLVVLFALASPVLKVRLGLADAGT